jgi:hypothetical protein
MSMNGIADIVVRITYADSSLVRRIRSWAKRNRARVSVEQYAKGYYCGEVTILSKWDEPRSSVQSRADALRALPGFSRMNEPYAAGSI